MPKLGQVVDEAVTDNRSSRAENPPLNVAVYTPHVWFSVVLIEGNDPVLSMVTGPNGMLWLLHAPPRTTAPMFTVAPDCETVAVVGQVNDKFAPGTEYVVLPV